MCERFWFSIFVITALPTFGVTASPSQRNEHDNYLENEPNNTDSSSMQRWKRASGPIQKLLNSARWLCRDYGTKHYSKFGGYRQALSDFKSLHPADVWRNQLDGSQTGYLGETTIMLHKYAKNVYKLSISKDGKVTVISYYTPR